MTSLPDQSFQEILNMIEMARENALRKVNEELILLYWKVGEYLSQQSQQQEWGSAYVDEMARYISIHAPGIKGFNRRGLYRMKQFYEAYHDNQFVSPLVTQISWTSHLLILSACKTDEEREFYIKLCIKEHYSKRELQRQLDSAYYERYMLSKLKPTSPSLPEPIGNAILDRYVLEFLDLPDAFSEKDLQRSIIQNMKQFILECGRDFSFIGEEYRVQVGTHDYYIDLLFYHRGLGCLVAFELKIGQFRPEYVGKMDFYLEALDREVKKPTENPSVGVILCATKDDEVVEFALSRTMSPTLVAEYEMKLIDKEILRKKLHEFTALFDIPEDSAQSS